MADMMGRAARLAALRAEADAAEAEANAAVSPEDAEEHAEIARAEAARKRKDDALRAAQRAQLTLEVARLRKAANGAYVVESFDAEETAPGAGVYVLRSPSKEVWKTFRDAVENAAGNTEKIDRAYVNLAAACILWPEADADTWLAHREKYPALVQAIGDGAGRLGGIAAANRKR